MISLEVILEEKARRRRERKARFHIVKSPGAQETTPKGEKSGKNEQD